MGTLTNITAGQFAINQVLERLEHDGWRIQLYNTKVPGARWVVKAKKPGLKIGTFGLYGYGNNSRVAVKMLSIKIREHMEEIKNAKNGGGNSGGSSCTGRPRGSVRTKR